MNIQKLKKTSYVCLTLLSTTLPLATKADNPLLEEFRDQPVISGMVRAAQKDDSIAEESEKTPILLKDMEQPKYNLVGVALFAGRDGVSYLIKKATHSRISHVGLILSDINDENKWYCFESTGSAGEVMKGEYPHVRITPWNEEVLNYDGNISYRLFVFENQDRVSPDDVTNFVEEYDHKSYTKNPLRLLGALFHIKKKPRSQVLKTVFCSELTAETLMYLNILEDGIAGNYIPKDFTSKTRLPLNSNVTLTPEFSAD